jgi:hypothetical protein
MYVKRLRAMPLADSRAFCSSRFSDEAGIRFANSVMGVSCKPTCSAGHSGPNLPYQGAWNGTY